MHEAFAVLKLWGTGEVNILLNRNDYIHPVFIVNCLFAFGAMLYFHKQIIVLFLSRINGGEMLVL